MLTPTTSGYFTIPILPKLSTVVVDCNTWLTKFVFANNRTIYQLYVFTVSRRPCKVMQIVVSRIVLMMMQSRILLIQGPSNKKKSHTGFKILGFIEIYIDLQIFRDLFDDYIFP